MSPLKSDLSGLRCTTCSSEFLRTTLNYYSIRNHHSYKNSQLNNDVDFERLFSVTRTCTICCWFDTFNRSKGNFMFAWFIVYVCVCETVDHLYYFHLGEWLPNNNKCCYFTLTLAFIYIFHQILSISVRKQLWLSCNYSHTQSSCAYTQIHGLLLMSLFWSDGDHTFLASGRASVRVRALSCLILLICRFPDTRRVDLTSILFSS